MSSPVQRPSDDAPRVVICEDDPPLRRVYEALIHGSGRYDLVGSTAYGDDAVRLLDTVKIDLLLLDLQLPDRSGLSVLAHRQRVQPRCETLIVTAFGDEASVLGAIEAGATGYVLKDESGPRVLELMDELLAGGSPITPSVARLMLRRLRPSTRAADTEGRRLGDSRADGNTWLHSLPVDLPFVWSEREDQILMYVAKGYAVQEIADLLGRSANTIKTHVRRIYSKLQVHSRSEALHEARALGLLDRAGGDAGRGRAGA